MSAQASNFIASSKFDVLVPQATELDFEELFVNNEGQFGAIPISSIERRSLLYFGESSLTLLEAPSSYS